MASKHHAETYSCKSKTTSSSDVHFNISGVAFTVNRELLAAKSSKAALLFSEHIQGDVSHNLLRDAPADPESFELVARFCHGFEINLSTDNVVQVCCLAHYLGMTEEHSPNNLLKRGLLFFERRILPSWSKSIKALLTSENMLQQALEIGLVDACAESIISQALDNPRLLGEPIKNPSFDGDDDGERNENNKYLPNARRRLFILDLRSEDFLTMLSLQLYEPIIQAMIQRQIPVEYVAASLCQYAKRWVSSQIAEGEKLSIHKRNSQREIIESVIRLLPVETEILPCTILFEMLQSAVILQASSDCRNGIEIRIGNQLHLTTVRDLLIPFQGCIKELQYDTECIRRILKNFYLTNPNNPALIRVAELVEDFLAEVASDIDLNLSKFIILAEIAVAASIDIRENCDGIYKAVDIFLEKHGFLTETEREELCRLLDCNKMSSEARSHAALNERLPLRFVVQVLFVQQLLLRETVISEDGSRKLGDEDEEAARQRREIQKGSCSKTMKEEEEEKKKKEKVSLWKEMKRKFGCMTTINDCNCHVKKKKKTMTMLKVHPGKMHRH